MTTFNQLALRVIVDTGIEKEPNDSVLSPEHVFQWLKARYQEAIDAMPFGNVNKRMPVAFVTEAAKQDGTVAVTKGGNTATGTGTSFAASDVGRLFRPRATNVWYKIIGVTGQTLTLDTNYVDETSSGVAYDITSPFYIVNEIKWITSITMPGWGELDELSPAKMLELHPYRNNVPARPWHFVKHGLDQDSGRGLIELYPFPDQAYRLEAHGYAAVDEPTPRGSILRGIDETLLVVGASVDAYKYRSQLAASRKEPESAIAFMRLADMSEKQFERQLRKLTNRDGNDLDQPLVRVMIHGNRYHHSGVYDPVKTAYDHVWRT